MDKQVSDFLLCELKLCTGKEISMLANILDLQTSKASKINKIKQIMSALKLLSMPNYKEIYMGDSMHATKVSNYLNSYLIKLSTIRSLPSHIVVTPLTSQCRVCFEESQSIYNKVCFRCQFQYMSIVHRPCQSIEEPFIVKYESGSQCLMQYGNPPIIIKKTFEVKDIHTTSQIHIRSISKNRQPFIHTWPQKGTVSVLGVSSINIQYVPKTAFIKRKDYPMIIDTQQIKANNITIELAFAIDSSVEEYAVVIQRVDTLDINDIIQTSAHSASLYDYFSDISNENSEIITIPFECPITLGNIRTCVKGKDCHHYRTFDLENYLSIPRQGNYNWSCPICGGHVYEIVIDDLQTSLITHFRNEFSTEKELAFETSCLLNSEGCALIRQRKKILGLIWNSLANTCDVIFQSITEFNKLNAIYKKMFANVLRESKYQEQDEAPSIRKMKTQCLIDEVIDLA